MHQSRATSEEKRCALNEVLNSATLARSDRLKNLLRFLCESEIEGRSFDLNEYVIGVQALGQPAGYSPTENSAVRSRVYELRHKLETFYSAEAPEAPIRIHLLKGSYVPKFVRCDAAVPEFTGVAATPGRWLWFTAAAFLAGLLLMFLVLRGPVAGGLPHPVSAPARATAGTPWTPELKAIWSPFLDPKVPLLVSFESRLFVRIGSVNVRDWTVDEMARVESSQKLMAIKDLFHQPQLYENRNYADFGAVQAAFEIARLLGTRNPRLSLKRSSGVGPDDTRDNDVIFLSKPSTDPVLRQLLARGPFIDERLRVRNLDPKPGELSEYAGRPDPKDPDRAGERYLLITLMPGLHQKRRFLSLACFNSEDPWALAEYLTSPEHAKEMYVKMRLPSGKMPEFYQVVVKAVFRAQSPIQIEYVTHRVLTAGSGEKQ
ncbi:MAG: hypothetical protein ACR2NN_08055 [Bryobacteraceae bacterium]